jgi:hypothetical protein
MQISLHSHDRAFVELASIDIPSNFQVFNAVVLRIRGDYVLLSYSGANHLWHHRARRITSWSFARPEGNIRSTRQA